MGNPSHPNASVLDVNPREDDASDEDTQRGTDRLIRVILQDLTEMEAANSQKDGIERSPRRVANMMAKLDKLQGSFDQFLLFAGV